MQFRAVLVVLACSHLVTAYLTHAGMRNLTVLTDELRGRIDTYDESREQRVLGGGEETEVVSSVSLRPVSDARICLIWVIRDTSSEVQYRPSSSRFHTFCHRSIR